MSSEFFLNNPKLINNHAKLYALFLGTNPILKKKYLRLPKSPILKNKCLKFIMLRWFFVNHQGKKNKTKWWIIINHKLRKIKQIQIMKHYYLTLFKESDGLVYQMEKLCIWIQRFG